MTAASHTAFGPAPTDPIGREVRPDEAAKECFNHIDRKAVRAVRVKANVWVYLCSECGTVAGSVALGEALDREFGKDRQ